MNAAAAGGVTSPIKDFLSGSSSAGGLSSMMNIAEGLGGLANPVSAVLSQLDFSTQESGSADSYSGGLSLFGKMGDTGKIHFTKKLKTEDYLLLILGGLLIFYII